MIGILVWRGKVRYLGAVDSDTEFCRAVSFSRLARVICIPESLFMLESRETVFISNGGTEMCEVLLGAREEGKGIDRPNARRYSQLLMDEQITPPRSCAHTFSRTKSSRAPEDDLDRDVGPKDKVTRDIENMSLEERLEDMGIDPLQWKKCGHFRPAEKPGC